MVLKMNLKEVRGMWVDKKISELQRQMAMVQRFLEKLGKVKSMDGRTPFCHSMLPTDQEMFSSLSNESENFVGVEFFPCSHDEEIESYSNLFHDEQVLSKISDQFDPNSPPIFDSYEQEDELHEAGHPVYDEYLRDLDDSNSLGLPPSGFCAEHEAMTAPNGLNQANTDLNLDNDYKPMFWESFFALNNHLSSSKGFKKARGSSFKNCYVFTREGLYSVLALMDEPSFKPGVQNGMINGDNVAPSHSIQSWFAQAVLAQGMASTSECIPSTFKGPCTHGPRLLDFYIEDDELKDVEGIFLGLKYQDLRSNLQQPGVFDAGASPS